VDYHIRKRGKSNAPCRDCEFRELGCHSDCRKSKMEEYGYYGYPEFKADMEAVRTEWVSDLEQRDMILAVRKKRFRA